jgi:hypothetical protein
VHYNIPKDVVANEEISFEYIPTEEMVADIFTKALDRMKHKQFTKGLGLALRSKIESISRGYVEAKVNPCVLLPQSDTIHVTSKMSQRQKNNSRAPKSPKQSENHTEWRLQPGYSNHQEKVDSQTEAPESPGPPNEIAIKIERMDSAIRKKTNSINCVNKRKQKYNKLGKG